MEDARWYTVITGAACFATMELCLWLAGMYGDAVVLLLLAGAMGLDVTAAAGRAWRHGRGAGGQQ
jgi:hypothetical protein